LRLEAGALLAKVARPGWQTATIRAVRRHRGRGLGQSAMEGVPEMMTTLDRIALLLVTVGAVNWGSVGLFRFDLVAALVGLTFGEVNAVSSIVYVLVAVSGLFLLRQLARPVYVPPQRSVHSV
jgi:uncharacterized membrane protein YuzA (DUF378 family)